MSDGVVLGAKVPPTIHLMFPTGEKATYEITKETTAAELISQVAQDPKITHPANRTISLIYHGRILKDSDVLAKLDSLSEFTIHVFYRATAPSEPPRTENGAGAQNEPMDSDLRGFDRLRRMNYDQAEIDALRQNFHAIHGTTDASAEERIEAEEEWFPVIFNHENPLQDLQLPGRRQRRPRRQRATETPFVNNEDEGQIIEENEFASAPWVRALIGFVVGALFGIGALLLFLFVSFTDPWFLLGLFAGCCTHYAGRYLLGLDIV